jgi:hypothetical protein
MATALAAARQPARHRARATLEIALDVGPGLDPGSWATLGLVAHGTASRPPARSPATLATPAR